MDYKTKKLFMLRAPYKIISKTTLIAAFLVLSATVSAQMDKVAAIVPVINMLLAGECDGGLETGPQQVTTQAQLDALTGVSKINGDLEISGNADWDFSALDTLTEITGALIIRFNDSLQSIQGFNCLQSVGVLEVRVNSSLLTISGFNRLQSGAIDISSNHKLQSVSGFSDLATADRIGFDLNDELEQLPSFAKLQKIENNFRLSRLFKLSTFPSFNSLTQIGGNLGFSTVSLPANLELPNQLNSIGGFISIVETTNLDTISGAENLNSIGGYFNISRNPSLGTINGFDKLSSVGGNVNIINNAMLSSFPQLAALNTVYGDIEIADNPSLLILDTLPALHTLTQQDPIPPFQESIHGPGDLIISTNSTLTSIMGFGQLENINSLRILSNPQLNHLNAFPSLSTVAQNVSVTSNGTEPAALFEINGFNALTQVGGSFTASTNSGLTKIGGFNMLSNLDGLLSIFGNGALTEIDAFTSLQNIGESLGINNNAVLSTLTGFDQLQTDDIGMTAEISGNTLFNCPASSLPFLPIDQSQNNLANCLNPQVLAFAYTQNATSSSSPADPRFSYNASGGTNSIARISSNPLSNSPGRYEAQFPGILFNQGQVHVNAYGSTGNTYQCHASGVNAPFVTVRCYDNNGNLVDGQFTVSIVGQSDNRRANVVAYAHMSNKDLDVGALGVLTNSANTYSSNTTTTQKLAIGHYLVSFPGATFRADESSNTSDNGSIAIVSAYGSNHHCAVDTWTTSTVTIYCFDTLGNPVNSEFMVAVHATEDSDIDILAYAEINNVGTVASGAYNVYGDITAQTGFSATIIVSFEGIEIEMASSPIHVQVSPIGSSADYCTSHETGGVVGGDILVHCYTSSGNLIRSDFSIAVYQ